ncbi:hypothetical protein [Bermanella sp. R86510]
MSAALNNTNRNGDAIKPAVIGNNIESQAIAHILTDTSNIQDFNKKSEEV